MATVKTTPKSKTSVKKPPLENRKCSFCGRSPSSTNFLIAGPEPYNCFICENCVEICLTVLLDASNSDWTRRLLRLMSKPKKSEILKMDKVQKKENPKTKRKRKV